MVQNDPGALIRRMLPPECLYKVALRIHEVEVDAMIYQIVLTRLDILRCAEVDAILLAKVLNLFVRASQTDEVGVELGKIALESFGVVSFRIASHKYGQQGILGNLLLDRVKHASHLIELFRANVGAASKTEVDLV